MVSKSSDCPADTVESSSNPGHGNRSWTRVRDFSVDAIGLPQEIAEQSLSVPPPGSARRVAMGRGAAMRG